MNAYIRSIRRIATGPDDGVPGMLSPLFCLWRALPALRRHAVRRVLLKQIYFTSNQAGYLVSVIGFAMGAIVVLQLHDEYGQSWETALRVLGRLGFNELAPLLGSLIMVARSSSAIASELVNMRASGEFRCLVNHGIDIAEYLLLPRVLGMTLSALVLSGCLGLFSLAGGIIFSAGWDAGYQVAQIERMLEPAWVLVCMGKSALFGCAAATLACAVGLVTRPLPTEIPKAASRAVFIGIMMLFIIDFAWSLLP